MIQKDTILHTVLTGSVWAKSLCTSTVSPTTCHYRNNWIDNIYQLR